LWPASDPQRAGKSKENQRTSSGWPTAWCHRSFCPPDAIAASRLEAMRNSVKTMLRAYEVAPPSDAFLDNLLTEMSEWHDMPLDKPETWRREF
jgi:hypothetical protein